MNHRALPLIPFVLLTLASCQREAVPQVATKAEDPVVPVAAVQRADIASSSVLTGEFEPFQEVEIMAKVAGYVQSLKVDIGDRVSAGQLIAVLEVPEMKDDQTRAAANVEQNTAEMEAAQDELARSESAYQIAHLSYTRLQEVAKREVGLIPLQEVDEVRSRDSMAQSQVSAAKSKLRVAQQRTEVAKADQAHTRTMGNYVSISAPFAGTITRRYASLGAMVQAGTASQTQAMPLVRLSQTNLLRLNLPVPERIVASVRVGRPVNLRVPALNRTVTGRVARFSNKVDQATRTMVTEVDVPNPKGEILSGMYAEVTLGLEDHKQALTVPLEALERSSAGTKVYAIEGGTVKIIAVSLGLEDDRRAELLSGIAENTLVVTGQRSGLRDGQRVRTRMVDVAAETK